jgi:hypothetical protein
MYLQKVISRNQLPWIEVDLDPVGSGFYRIRFKKFFRFLMDPLLFLPDQIKFVLRGSGKFLSCYESSFHVLGPVQK